MKTWNSQSPFILSKLDFPKAIFIEMFLKGLNYKHMNLDMEKNVNFNMFLCENTLDLDSENGL